MAAEEEGAAMGTAEDRQRRDSRWNAELIRQLRRHSGLSQRQLANELNARQQTISEWERGAYTPRGTAARLLTRVAEDVAFPFAPDGPADPSNSASDNNSESERATQVERPADD